MTYGATSANSETGEEEATHGPRARLTDINNINPHSFSTLTLPGITVNNCQKEAFNGGYSPGR